MDTAKQDLFSYIKKIFIESIQRKQSNWQRRQWLSTQLMQFAGCLIRYKSGKIRITAPIKLNKFQCDGFWPSSFLGKVFLLTRASQLVTPDQRPGDVAPSLQKTRKMTEVENRGHIFISYAWGNGFENKEWVRQRVLTQISWNHDVFWDRDSIAYGDSIDCVIAKALSRRPVQVLCLCDQDYIRAAQQKGSGLHRELKMLAEIADAPGVRIVPVILETGCADQLPEPLIGRLYLDLQPLHQLNIDLGTAMMEVAEGRTPAQVQSSVNARLAAFKLRERALKYFQARPVEVWGNGRNHEVTVYREGTPPSLLQPAPWMWESNNWNYMLNDDWPTFCPTKGRWHWELSSSSTEMRPLATAVLSVFFDQLDGRKAEPWLNQGGIVLANTFFRTVLESEPFRFDADDLIGFLMRRDEGYEALEKLLDAADENDDRA